MEVYEAEDHHSKFKEVYGKNLKELKSDWIEYVNKYEE